MADLRPQQGAVPYTNTFNTLWGVEHNDDGTTKLTLDTVPAPIGPVPLAGQKITGLGTPTASTDAVTKAYADALSSGLTVKNSVQAATTANITLSGEQTIDGVAVVAGDRVLVKNQSTASQNGIYDAAVGAWARSSDADTSGEVPSGIFTLVAAGTTQISTGWVLTTANPITLGSTSLTFTQFTAPGSGLPISTVDAKGDLIVGTADNTVTRLAVGSNTQILTADSAQASGTKWAAPAVVALDAAGAPSDTTTLNASTSAHGLLRKLSNIATQYLDGTGAFSVPPVTTDATLTATDITTNNASTSKHGFLKKLSNVAGQYMDGTGNWSVPSGGDTSTGFTNVKNATYGAVGDGSTNDGTALTAALTAAGTGVTFLPAASYNTSALTTLIYSKLVGLGSLLKASANSMTVLTLKSGQALQSSDYLLVRDIRVDGTGRTGITGVATDGGAGGSLAHGILQNLVVTNTDTVGINLGNAQFLRTYNLKASSGTGIGLLIANNATSGGGNSHDHYGLQTVDKEVGVLVNGTRYSTPCWSHNFYNPQCLGNSVCGMAFFTANATLYGGAPENNASGSATVSADGQTVKKSSMYLVNSLVRAVGYNIGEATANPCHILETGSTLVLDNASGYGVSTGVLVKADATSQTILEGTFNCSGVVQNVGGWPDNWILPTTAQSILYGKPVHKADPSLPVLYSHPAPPLVGGGAHAPTMTYVEDADLGYCRQAVFTSTAGGVSDNFANASGFTGAGSQDTVFSVLVKSSIDTQIGINFYNGAAYNTINTDQVFLKAGKVTRIVYGERNLAAGAWQLFWYPIGTDSPTLQFSKLQVYQGATGTQTTTQEIAKIVKDGAFNPGPLRDTTTNLALQSAAVNTKAKYPGKQVWNSTTNRVVFAAGPAVSDVWKDGVNSTVHTPV